MLRLLGALLLTCCGGGLGVLSAEKLRKTRDLSRQTSELLRQFSYAVRGQSAEFFELIEILRQGGRFPLLTFVKDLPSEFTPSVDILSLWRKAAFEQEGASCEQRQVLAQIGDAFSATEAEGVLRTLSVLEERSDLLEKQAQDRLEKCGKLYRSLGVLFGAMAGILVI